jgi:hypothetical protein
MKGAPKPSMVNAPAAASPLGGTSDIEAVPELPFRFETGAKAA